MNEFKHFDPGSLFLSTTNLIGSDQNLFW